MFTEVLFGKAMTAIDWKKMWAKIDAMADEAKRERVHGYVKTMVQQLVEAQLKEKKDGGA